MTDATPPRAFIGIQPCRVADTRGNGAPIQGGIFPNGGLRTWTVIGICGIPPGAEAISANFTVTGSPAAPPGAFLTAWPTGGPPPPVSILNFQAGQTVANAAIVPLSAAGQIQVNVSHSTHVIMDVNGYFSDGLANPANFLNLSNSLSGGATALFANSTNVNMSTGVLGLTGPAFAHPTNYFAAGVRGEGTLTGVLGISQSLGVAGSLVDGSGAETAYGILGFRSGVDFGVFGQTWGTAADSAGVCGQDAGNPGLATAGVRGVSVGGNGVHGRSGARGVRGDHIGQAQTTGFLGYDDSSGVHSSDNITAFGAKFFIEPHPADATKEIAYVSLEGPEAGTYFRGRGRLRRGMAVIEVPEDFRMVTDSEGLTVQVTPIGEIASIAVVSISLEGIVVRGSRDVEFFYMVNGVRKAFKDLQPVRTNAYFVPEGPEANVPLANFPELQRRLIATGIYNEDGTVNMETASRLGWDKLWERRSRPSPQPSEP